MKRRTRVTAAAVALGILLVMVVPLPASAATTNVSIVTGPTGFAFSPATSKVKMGDTVLWTNTTASSHTVRASGCVGNATVGPAAFCSGVVAPAGTFSTPVNVAATYDYICTIHTAMHGRVSVSPTAKPANGSVAQTYTITWAVGSIPAGFNADIQIQRPGQSFVDWTIDRTGSQLSGTFVPDAGPGTYSFKVRLQNSTTGNATPYSKTKGISAS